MQKPAKPISFIKITCQKCIEMQEATTSGMKVKEL